jgi:hypothetical protein
MEFLSRAVSPDDHLIRSSRLDSIFALPHFRTLARDGLFLYVEIGDTNARINTLTPVRVLKVRPNLIVASCPSPPQIIEGPSRINNWKEVLNALLLFLKENYNCVVVTIQQRPHDPQFARGKLDGCRLSYSYDAMIDLSNLNYVQSTTIWIRGIGIGIPSASPLVVQMSSCHLVIGLRKPVLRLGKGEVKKAYMSSMHYGLGQWHGYMEVRAS